MKKRYHYLLSMVLFCCLNSIFPVAQGGLNSLCRGHFVNPITDICWDCLLPITIGSVPVAHQGWPADTLNPTSPVQVCPFTPVARIGVAMGYWEPSALVDVTRFAGCMVNIGIHVSIPGLGVGGGHQSGSPSHGTFYNVHWYKYPLAYWLNIITDASCVQSGDMDIGYLSELDPTWNDDELATLLNPEAVLFANPIAQMACAADAIASSAHLSLDPLFWCAGSQGSMYPFTGHTSNEFSPLQSSTLLAERMDFKLHREGLAWDTIGHDIAVCYKYPTPIMPKDRYRYQMTNPIPDALACHPFGQSVMTWETGHLTPTSTKNFGYVIWRKRNCVMF